MSDAAQKIEDREAGLKGIGCSRKRTEDARFIQGKGNYVDDIKLPGMLHMDIVRSPLAHARITKLDKTEAPTSPGLWFMDSSSAAAEMVTLCAASGYTVHFFPTGQGNVIGNPILPVIKLCANPRTVRTMSEHIDVDVTGLLRKELTPDQAGDKLLESMFRTANGRLTAAEALGHREFVLTRLYESA